MDSRDLRKLLAERHHRNDRGASAILIAFAMMLLLGIAAVAIDLGAGFNERRQDQTTADLAGVAGGLSFGTDSAMVNQALAVARANLDTQYTNTEWQALWQGCTDPGRTAAFIPLSEPAAWGAGALDCLSMSPSFFRVRIPEQQTDTAFGQFLGVDTLTTDAYAVVTLWPTEGSGAFPFGIVAGAPAGEACLDTGPSGTLLPPCDDPASGSFGNIAPPLFGNTYQGTLPKCDEQTSANNNVAEAIAMGIDHLLWSYPSASWTATGWSSSDNTGSATVLTSTVNMDLCNEVTSGGETVAQPADGVPIDGVLIDTGNNVKVDATVGLISPNDFTDGDKGRLWRTDNSIDVMSGGNVFELDNTPLWVHLFADGATSEDGTVSYGAPYAPASCNPDEFPDTKTIDELNTQMQTCLTDYENGPFSGQIFMDTIIDTPRFGVAPQLWHDNLGSGLSYRPIERFRHIYLGGVWFDLQALTDHEVFYPGTPGSQWCVPKGAGCATIKEVEQLVAYLLLPDMISDVAEAIYPGTISDAEVTIYE
ncbi:MAG: hypothetical protein U9N56_05825 [Actinomycetota bacterium]|nr:hypothetical protein [Actinomycetota bacterium]